MRVYVTNPHLLTAIRGRASTVLIVRERSGQQVEIVFTSLKAMDAFADDVGDAVDAMLDGRERTIWSSEALRRDMAQLVEVSHGGDALYDAGLLAAPFDTPAPFRRRRRGEGVGVSSPAQDAKRNNQS